MSEFDELKAEVDSALTKLSGGCDGALKKAETWMERLRDVNYELGMSIAKPWEGETLKNEIKGNMNELSKVREEMKGLVKSINEQFAELHRISVEGEDVIEQGSPAERVLIGTAIIDLAVGKMKSVSDRVEWLKGYGRAVESFMKVWAKEKDQMEAMIREFEGNEAAWDDVGEVSSVPDKNPMYR
ncbi:MAG: hypothetical protein KAW39_01900 [Thermoplasmata archaeon]|nr:hypothetical protein [Thermoplasmata archaeon]